MSAMLGTKPGGGVWPIGIGIGTGGPVTLKKALFFSTFISKSSIS